MTGRVIELADDSIWTVTSPVKSVNDSSSTVSSTEESEESSTSESETTTETSGESEEPIPDPWTRKEIFQLFTMAKKGVRIGAIASALGRSTSAVQHAMRKMIIQQCVFHEAEDVAATYHMDIYDLHRILAPRKYYVPIDYAPADATATVPMAPAPASHVVPMTRSYPSWCIWAFVFMALPIIAMQPFVADFKP